MPTPYKEIFDKANVLFTDAELLHRLSDEELNELLKLFLSKAKSVYFKSCKKNLDDVDDVLEQFNVDIDEQEQWLIAQSMRIVWLDKQIYREEKLRDRIGSRDYQMHSPGNLLDKLILLKKETKRELNELLISYSFDEFEGFK